MAFGWTVQIRTDQSAHSPHLFTISSKNSISPADCIHPLRRSRRMRSRILRSSALSAELRSGVSILVTLAATPQNCFGSVISAGAVFVVGQFPVAEPVPGGESVASFSTSHHLTSSAGALVHLSAQLGHVRASQDHPPGFPEHAAARITKAVLGHLLGRVARLAGAVAWPAVHRYNQSAHFTRSPRLSETPAPGDARATRRDLRPCGRASARQTGHSYPRRDCCPPVS